MMLVRTYLARSEIHGFGVYAEEAIQAGTPVWDFTPGFDVLISEETFASLPLLAQEHIRHYGSLTAGPNQTKTYLLCSDHAKFMNHSENPNLHSATDPGYALRAFAAGEEITCNYGEFVVDFESY